MAWPSVSGSIVAVGLVSLFFWALIGQYAYREAKKEGRRSPRLRGLAWGVLGVVGAGGYLVRIREWEVTRLGWLAFAVALFAFWALATIGQGRLDRAFHAWAALFAGLLLLYWQFDLEAVDESGVVPETE